MNLLITCCLGDHMKSNVDDLREAFPDVKIVGIDMREMFRNHNDVDVFYKVCRCTSPKYIDEVLDICKKEKIDLILSFSSLDIEPFKMNKKRFDQIGVKIALGLDDMNFTMTANNKFLFCSEGKEDGIDIVESYLVKGDDDVKEFMESLGIDKVVVKQIYSTGAKGMEVLDKAELQEGLKYRQAALAQKFLGGDEYSVDCFCKNGTVLFACTKINYEMDLGVSIYSELVRRPDLEEMCSKACQKFCLDGLVGFDLMKDENGNVRILECNPRPTATISLVSKAGVNLLKHLVEYYLTGNTSFEGEQLKLGAKVRRYREDFYEYPVEEEYEGRDKRLYDYDPDLFQEDWRERE